MFSGLPDPSLPGDSLPGKTGGLHVQVWSRGVINMHQGGEAAPLSLQRLESEGNSYLASFPLPAKIPKTLREFYPYVICNAGTSPPYDLKTCAEVGVGEQFLCVFVFVKYNL